MTSSDRRETPSNRRPAGRAVEAQPICWSLATAQEMRELDRHATVLGYAHLGSGLLQHVSDQPLVVRSILGEQDPS